MPTIARVRCPHDKQHYKDNNGRSAYEVLGIVEISGVIKAVARHKKNDDKFLVAMSAADRAALTELLRSTYQNASDARYEEKYRVPDEYDELPPLKEDVLSPRSESFINRIVTPIKENAKGLHAATCAHVTSEIRPAVAAANAARAAAGRTEASARAAAMATWAGQDEAKAGLDELFANLGFASAEPEPAKPAPADVPPPISSGSCFDSPGAAPSVEPISEAKHKAKVAEEHGLIDSEIDRIKAMGGGARASSDFLSALSAAFNEHEAKFDEAEPAAPPSRTPLLSTDKSAFNTPTARHYSTRSSTAKKANKK